MNLSKLKWSNADYLEMFQLCKSLHKGLNEFRLNGNYCDVTIHIEGKTFQCHRAVLASACKYFHCLFGGNFKEGSSQMKDINLPDIDAISFNILLEFIYLGREPNLNEDNIFGLFRSSDFLELQIIKTFCDDFILRNTLSFSPVTAFNLFHLVCGLNDRLMMEVLSRYFVAYLKDFIQKDFFLEMAYDCLNLVLQQYRLSTINFLNENFLLDALIRWIFHNFERRRQYFQELINAVNFNKISEDCAEFLLKKYKANCGTKLESDNSAEASKKLVLEGFSRLENFINDDNILPVSYEEPQLEITPSIYVYGREIGNTHYQGRYTVFSLSESDNCRTETATNSSDLFSRDDSSVKTNWVTSCTFPMSRKPTLVSSGKLKQIYCLFNSGIFRAYNTVDLSSNQYTELAPLLQSCYSEYTGACGTDDGDIYFCDDEKINCYNCDVDKWFPMIDPEEGVTKCSFFAHNNLLYVIEGQNSEGQVLNEYIRAYDRRTSNWLELSKPEPHGLVYSCNTSCVMDGKIYVFNGYYLKFFDPVAGRWKYVEIGETLHEHWPCPPFKRQWKMISYKKKLFIFVCSDRNYSAYDPITNAVEKSSLSYYCSGIIRSFSFENTISFESMEM